MKYSTLDNLSDYFFSCRNEGDFGAQLAKPKDLIEAYYIQHSNYARLGEIGGWKLGGCSPASREFFNVEDIYYGPIFKDKIYSYKSIINAGPCQENFWGELEVVFRFSVAIADYLDFEVTSDNAQKYIMSVFPAIEMPRFMFQVSNDSLAMIIADQCVSGGLVLGNEVFFNKDILSSTANILATLVSAQDDILDGESRDIIGGPFNAFCDFLKLAQQHKLNLCPGQYISTGAFSTCKRLPFNSLLQADFGALGNFEFSINT
ncbi:hypothetical protein [Aeromonas enterica]